MWRSLESAVNDDSRTAIDDGEPPDARDDAYRVLAAWHAGEFWYRSIRRLRRLFISAVAVAVFHHCRDRHRHRLYFGMDWTGLGVGAAGHRRTARHQIHCKWLCQSQLAGDPALYSGGPYGGVTSQGRSFPNPHSRWHRQTGGGKTSRPSSLDACITSLRRLSRQVPTAIFEAQDLLVRFRDGWVMRDDDKTCAALPGSDRHEAEHCLSGCRSRFPVGSSAKKERKKTLPAPASPTAARRRTAAASPPESRPGDVRGDAPSPHLF